MRARGSGWLHLRAGEAGPIAILVGWYFCVIGAAFVARSVRDSLFLAHLSAARLPSMYVATPLIVTAVGFAYARIEGKLRRDRLAIGTAVASGAVLVLARLLLGTGDWIYYTLYVAVSVISGLVIMQLWMAASDRFTSRDAKRLFGLVGAGGTLADIVIGAVLALLAPHMAVEDLLYLAAGLLFTAAALAIALGRLGGRVQARPRPARARGAKAEGR
ncbi:MAG TPA: hypothetical protein VHE35_12180, partial [Kofleriaceae bacterium]|nr:hypothetical protein [Kofleriaceae bacterium]